MSAFTAIAAVLAIIVTASNAAPYSKYGRSCKDIGCRSDEVCVMAEDPCGGYQRDSCGRYPTCQRTSSGGESCTTKMCPTGQYCKTENGKPTCVNTTPGLAFDSAGISSVNGHRVDNNQPSVPVDPSGSSRYANNNPYANANAPPAEDVNHGHNKPSYANNDPGYPPYPTNNNNNGYPPYPAQQPSNNNNNGYPPYPAQQPSNNNNRPGVPVDQYGYPLYPPSQSRPDNRYHNVYPQHNLPQHNPGWSNAYPNTIYRRNAASLGAASTMLLICSLLLSAFSLRISGA